MSTKHWFLSTAILENLQWSVWWRWSAGFWVLCPVFGAAVGVGNDDRALFLWALSIDISVLESFKFCDGGSDGDGAQVFGVPCAVCGDRLGAGNDDRALFLWAPSADFWALESLKFCNGGSDGDGAQVFQVLCAVCGDAVRVGNYGKVLVLSQ